MIGIDWLRRKTADAVRIGPGPLGEPTHADAARLIPLIAHALAQNERDLGEQQRSETAAARARYCQERGWLDCTCVVIYSRCYYGH